MAKVYSDVWIVQGINVPVHLYTERRASKRVSITKTGINIRIPTFGARLTIKSDVQWARKWVDSQIIKTPDLLDRFKTPDYNNGYIVSTPTKDYMLEVYDKDRATSASRLNGNKIIIKLNNQLSVSERTKTIRTLISRVIGADQLARISKRIHEINDNHFRQPIQQIRIKNNSSNWGSCSTTGNINISIKTLLAPLWIQDYIFVHELAHRLEMNHSPKYWNIVASVMPDYDRAEAWIKKYGNKCEV